MKSLIVVIAACNRSGEVLVRKLKQGFNSEAQYFIFSMQRENEIANRLRGLRDFTVVIQERVSISNKIEQTILARRPFLWLNESTLL